MADDLETSWRPRRSRWRSAPWVVATFLLLLPLIAMQFTDEVAWDETDFLVTGILLFGACGAFEAAARLSGDNWYRVGVAVAVIAALLLIWINLAVGIIGSEDDPANLMYGGVLMVGLVGASFARFEASGMARALFATAFVQALAGVIALLAGWGSEGENWPQVILVLNGFFAMLWLGSAALFRNAARNRGGAAAAP